MAACFRSLLVLGATLSVGACTTIDTGEPVEGWPQLRVVEHYVPDATMRQRCSKYVAFGMLPLACAEFNFASGECHVWYSANFPPSQSVMEHERLHCQGYEHPGDTTLRDVLARYRASRISKS